METRPDYLELISFRILLYQYLKPSIANRLEPRSGPTYYVGQYNILLKILPKIDIFLIDADNFFKEAISYPSLQHTLKAWQSLPANYFPAVIKLKFRNIDK